MCMLDGKKKKIISTKEIESNATCTEMKTSPERVLSTSSMTYLKSLK